MIRSFDNVLLMLFTNKMVTNLLKARNEIIFFSSTFSRNKMQSLYFFCFSFSSQMLLNFYVNLNREKRKNHYVTKTASIFFLLIYSEWNGFHIYNIWCESNIFWYWNKIKIRFAESLIFCVSSFTKKLFRIFTSSYSR